MKKIYKKIWKDERFVLSEENLIYEEIRLFVGGCMQTEYRQLQPTFYNRFWEVYALHCSNALYYVVIGKHHDGRLFYKKEMLFSRTGRYYLPIGRDLAVKAMGDTHWEILSQKKGHLVDVTEKFSAMSGLPVTHVGYVSPVVSITQRTPYGSGCEVKSFWKQTEKGYQQIEEKDVKQAILNASGLPEDPWFV